MGAVFPERSDSAADPVDNTVISSFLAQALADLNRKPRSRSEWEDRFVHWQRPASETEEQKIARAANRVRLAMRHSPSLPHRRWTIVKQGSYHNNTNTRSESDIDLCVCLTDAFFTDGPSHDFPTMAELNQEPVPFTFENYRNHIAWCLEQEFGPAAVTIGKKAIHLHKGDGDRINSDVVPAYRLQKYSARQGLHNLRPAPELGVALLTAEGRLVKNFPEQHYTNGCAKNDRTSRRYKRVVRILKRIRNHLADNVGVPQAIRDRAKGTASFLIESLVYNCPDQLFGAATIYDDVVAILNFLSLWLTGSRTGTTILTAPMWTYWWEVNQQKLLFGPEQAWTAESASEFVNATRAYMDL